MNFTQALLLALIISLVTTPLTQMLFQRLGWVDDPAVHKHPKVTHHYPVPRGGGIPIFLATISTGALFLPWDRHLQAITLASFLALIVGLADDLWDLNPYLRFATNCLVAFILVKAGITLKIISNPFGGTIDLTSPFLLFLNLGEWLTVFWLVWCMNAISWSGGIEGQLPGFVAITALIIALLGVRFSQDITQWPVIILASGVAGAWLGFLPYNFYPQSIMPGYSGKSLGGLFLGILAVLSGAKLATAILTLGVPMSDALFAIIRRLAKGRSPFWGDAHHLHHLLLRLGLPKTKIALFYWFASLVLGLLVVNLNSQQKLWGVVMVGVAVGMITLGLRIVLDKKGGHSNFSA